MKDKPDIVWAVVELILYYEDNFFKLYVIIWVITYVQSAVNKSRIHLNCLNKGGDQIGVCEYSMPWILWQDPRPGRSRTKITYSITVGHIDTHCCFKFISSLLFSTPHTVLGFFRLSQGLWSHQPQFKATSLFKDPWEIDQNSCVPMPKWPLLDQSFILIQSAMPNDKSHEFKKRAREMTVISGTDHYCW